MKETKLVVNRLVIFLFVNLGLLSLLYLIPWDNNPLLSELCLYKKIFGVECWNCGMTRAFLSILHLDFQKAFNHNSNVIIVFPCIVITYFFAWCKYILRKEKVI